MNLLRRVWKCFNTIADWLEVRCAPVFFRCTIISVGFTMANRIDSKDLIVYYTSIGVLFTLSSVSFSYSRAAEHGKEVSVGITHSGERFLHAALMLLPASVLKYFAIKAVGGYPIPATFLSFLALPFIVRAIMFSLTGITSLTNILWKVPRNSLYEVE